MTLTVCMITYNQQGYIKQAVESVLAQKTSFDFELNIFNDASTDDTDAAIREIMDTHPRGKLINYHLHPRNIGLSANYIFSIQHCNGKYAAICEGDDYWTDYSKLQKQVEFLEKNPAYYLCFHQGLRVNTVTNEYSVYPQLDMQHFDVTTFFDIVTIPMASVVFRNNSNIYFRHGHSQMDFMLLCSLLMQGPVFFIEEIMSVYRIHGKAATFNHFSGTYLKKRVADLGEEAEMPEFNTAVRKEIAHMYVTHVLIAITNFRKEFTGKEVAGYLAKSMRLKKRPQSYSKEYKKIFVSLSPILAAISSIFNIRQMKHFFKKVYDKLTVRGFRDQVVYEIQESKKELNTLNERLFLNNPVMPIGGVKFYLPLFYTDHIQKIIYTSRNFYEIETLEFLRLHYHRFNYIIDVGSNMGNHVLFYCQNLNPKKVYCFEPNEINRTTLQKNIELNRLDDIVTVYPVALGEEVGKGIETNFWLKNTGMNRISKISPEDNNENSIEIKRLDDFNIQQVDFIKIDVEGFEVAVLKGAAQTIRKYKPVLMIEVFETNRTEVDELLNNFGYKKLITLEVYNDIYVSI